MLRISGFNCLGSVKFYNMPSTQVNRKKAFENKIHLKMITLDTPTSNFRYLSSGCFTQSKSFNFKLLHCVEKTGYIK